MKASIRCLLPLLLLSLLIPSALACPVRASLSETASLPAGTELSAPLHAFSFLLPPDEHTDPASAPAIPVANNRPVDLPLMLAGFLPVTLLLVFLLLFLHGLVLWKGVETVSRPTAAGQSLAWTALLCVGGAWFAGALPLTALACGLVFAGAEQAETLTPVWTRLWLLFSVMATVCVLAAGALFGTFGALQPLQILTQGFLP